MLENKKNSQNPVSLKITLYSGQHTSYVSRVVRTALRRVLGRDMEGYEVTDGNGTVKLTGEGPYTKNKLFEIAKQAILGRINPKSKRPTKLQSEVKSPLFLYRK